MKRITFVIAMCLISFVCKSQKAMLGQWKISSEKKLTLSKNKTFVLIKGDYTHKGTWAVEKKKKANDELVLSFDSQDIVYGIEDTKSNRILLYDIAKDQVLVLDKIEPVKSETTEANEPIKEAPKKIEKPHILNSENLEKQERPQEDFFYEDAWVVNPGYGFFNYIDSLPSAITGKVPAISILIERNIWNRVGVGAKLGYRSWEIPEIENDLQLFSLASRVTYHPKLKFLPKFDTYAGGAIIVRFGHSKLPDETHSKWSADFSPVLGLRYYIAKRFAFTGEYAYDHTSNITLGFSILIN